MKVTFPFLTFTLILPMVLTPSSIIYGQATKLVSPTAFLQLPRDIALDLKARRSKIPQWIYPSPSVANKPGPHNVIRGRFFKRNQNDWAVLCLGNRRSSIIIYLAESATNVLEIDKRSDLAADWSNFKGGNFEYGRMITSAGRKSILYYYKEFAEPQGEPKPPPIDHEGIEDHYIGKASAIHYYYRGKWLRLQGAD